MLPSVLPARRYAYKPGMKLTDLISSYIDVLPEPALNYAEIIRLIRPTSIPVWKASISARRYPILQPRPYRLPMRRCQPYV